eukprot:1982666-Amphidinium_carterae.2
MFSSTEPLRCCSSRTSASQRSAEWAGAKTLRHAALPLTASESKLNAVRCSDRGGVQLMEEELVDAGTA